jgi:hypothetical protein
MHPNKKKFFEFFVKFKKLIRKREARLRSPELRTG